MPDDLTEQEIERLRDLAQNAEEILSEVRYRTAVRLVFGRWRQAVLIVTGTLGALFVLRDQLGEFITWIINKPPSQ